MRDIVIHNIEAEYELQEIEENLQRLIVGVPNISIDHDPRRYQLKNEYENKCLYNCEQPQ